MIKLIPILKEIQLKPNIDPKMVIKVYWDVGATTNEDSFNEFDSIRRKYGYDWRTEEYGFQVFIRKMDQSDLVNVYKDLLAYKNDQVL